MEDFFLYGIIIFFTEKFIGGEKIGNGVLCKFKLDNDSYVLDDVLDGSKDYGFNIRHITYSKGAGFYKGLTLVNPSIPKSLVDCMKDKTFIDNNRPGHYQCEYFWAANDDSAKLLYELSRD